MSASLTLLAFMTDFVEVIIFYQYFSELTAENTEVDWSSVLESALKESEKYVLPMAVFKVLKWISLDRTIDHNEF